jgi:uncharacterized protein
MLQSALAIIFLLAILALLSGMHFFLLSFLNDAFLARKIGRAALSVASVLLASSFIATTLLVHASSSRIFKWLYEAASLWLGAFPYLLMAALAAWMLSRLSGPGRIASLAAASVFILAVLLVFYGLWNARQLTVREISPGLPVPDAWQGKSAVLLTDLHLGAINDERFMRRVVDEVNRIGPKAVFISGDYFDGTCNRFAELTAPLSGIRSRIFFVNGNHEIYINGGKFDEHFERNGVLVLNNEKTDLDGLGIVGIDFRVRTKENFASVMEAVNPTAGSVLLYHQPVNLAEAEAAGIGLMLSGHTHRGQFWPFNYFTYAIFGKYHYGLNPYGRMRVYTSNGAGTWGPPLRIGNRPEIVKILF